MGIFERALKSVDVLVEGSTVLEYMPFLTAIPTWLPGTGFLRRLAEDRKYAHMLRELPWTQAKEMVVRVALLFSLNHQLIKSHSINACRPAGPARTQ